MSKFLEFIDGKKTYITAIAVFVCGGLMALGVEIPEFVWVVLGALGLTGVRSALNKK